MHMHTFHLSNGYGNVVNQVQLENWLILHEQFFIAITASQFIQRHLYFRITSNRWLSSVKKGNILCHCISDACALMRCVKYI